MPRGPLAIAPFEQDVAPEHPSAGFRHVHAIEPHADDGRLLRQRAGAGKHRISERLGMRVVGVDGDAAAPVPRIVAAE